jgi:hypothetical protein
VFVFFAFAMIMVVIMLMLVVTWCVFAIAWAVTVFTGMMVVMNTRRQKGHGDSEHHKIFHVDSL